MRNVLGIASVVPIGLVAWAFAASATSADLRAEDCADTYIHHYWEAPQDFGDGFVLARTGHEGYFSQDDTWGAEGVVLSNCDTGEFLSVRLAQQDAYKVVAFDFTKPVLARLGELGTAEFREDAIDDLAQFATQIGAPIRARDVSNSETCGCQVYYPELRGKKVKYAG